MSWIEIDGAMGEGGGQVVRTAVSLSAITGQPLRITNVRAGRQKPGLQPQHLAAVEAAAGLCVAELKGAAVGSIFLEFAPTEPVKPGEFLVDIGTAGSTTLVAQTMLAPLWQAGGESQITIIGGTHNPLAPTFEYLREVYLETLRAFGWDASAKMVHAGFYPAGGGRIELTVRPATPRPIALTQPVPTRLRALVVQTLGRPDLANRVMTRMPEGTELGAVKASGGSGVALTLMASPHAAFSALGQKGLPMEAVGESAVSQYEAWAATGAPVDEHLADQLVLPAALTRGVSRWRTSNPTAHLTTVLKVVRMFLPVRTQLGDGGEVEVQG